MANQSKADYGVGVASSPAPEPKPAAASTFACLIFSFWFYSLLLFSEINESTVTIFSFVKFASPLDVEIRRAEILQ